MLKKILLICVATLCLVGCSKERVMQGTYSCSLDGSTLFVELLAGGNCVAYFSDESDSDNGSYFIDGDEITLIFSISHGKISSYRYRFYMFRDAGSIYDNNSFGVTAHEVMNDKDVYCSFVRRN